MAVRGVRRSWDTARSRFPRFGLQLFLAFQLGGQGPGHYGHHQRHHSRGNALRRNQIKGPVRVSKSKIHRQHADQGSGNAPEISLGAPGNQKYPQHKNHGNQALGIKQLLQNQIDKEGGNQCQQGKNAVGKFQGKKLHGITSEAIIPAFLKKGTWLQKFCQKNRVRIRIRFFAEGKTGIQKWRKNLWTSPKIFHKIQRET